MATQGVRDDVQLASVEAAESCLSTEGLNRPRSLCPCCGQEWADRTDLDVLLMDVSPLLRRALMVIARRPGIDGNALADAVYGSYADGGPLTGKECIASTLSRSRKLIERHGFVVRGRGNGAGFGYRIIRLGDE